MEKNSIIVSNPIVSNPKIGQIRKSQEKLENIFSWLDKTLKFVGHN